MVDASVLFDLYQQYKYDLCYGAIEKDMSFEEWMATYQEDGENT